jgi:predicted N-acetyltransferase YhbS
MDWDPLPRQISTFYLLCVIGHPRFCSVAVDGDGRIVGVLLATPDELGNWLYVNHVRVEPDVRSAGIGQALIKHVEGQGRAAGIERIWLLTSEDVEPFYEPLNYERDASFMPAAVRKLMAEHRPAAIILSKRL